MAATLAVAGAAFAAVNGRNEEAPTDDPVLADPRAAVDELIGVIANPVNVVTDFRERLDEAQRWINEQAARITRLEGQPHSVVALRTVTEARQVRPARWPSPSSARRRPIDGTETQDPCEHVR